MSNYIQLVDREFTHPSIDGVSFGGRVWIVARSPRHVLIWVFGHSWSLNGSQRYAGPNMALLDRRGPAHRGIVRVMEDVRLSAGTFDASWEKVSPSFDGDDDVRLAIKRAIDCRPKKTVLIEGGGYPLMPDRTRWETEYQRWRSLPEKGFRMPVGNF